MRIPKTRGTACSLLFVCHSRELGARLLAARGFLLLITQQLGGAAGVEEAEAAPDADEAGPSQACFAALHSLLLWSACAEPHLSTQAFSSHPSSSPVSLPAAVDEPEECAERQRRWRHAGARGRQLPAALPHAGGAGVVWCGGNGVVGWMDGGARRSIRSIQPASTQHQSYVILMLPCPCLSPPPTPPPPPATPATPATLQQAEVRRVVYSGLPALLAADPGVRECLVEPLLPHFLQFYEADEALTPPLKMEACVRLQVGAGVGGWGADGLAGGSPTQAVFSSAMIWCWR